MPCVNEALPGCDNPPTPLLCTCMQVSDDVHIYSLSVVHTQSPQGHLEGRDQVVVYACTTAWYCKVRGVCLWPHSSSLRGHPLVLPRAHVGVGASSGRSANGMPRHGNCNPVHMHSAVQFRWQCVAAQ
jgi:hypothetical protein